VLRCAVPGADGLFMVVDERGVFKDDSFQAAVAALQDGNAAQSGKGGGKGDKKQPKQVRGCWTHGAQPATGSL
jgi:ATP-dependent RNA helicase DOB1